MLKTQYKFSTAGCYYLYDCTTNEILKIAPDIYKIFPKWKYLNGSCPELDKAVDKKLISLQPPILMNPAEHPNFKKAFDNIASNIALCVTEKCNLRCEYCLYSSNSAYWRPHSSKSMSFETAMKALHRFKECFDGTEYPVISFYGGEPLLEFDLIKKIVKEAQKLFSGKYVSFNITTNGTIINSEIANFLAKNNFNPLISIDGPKLLHDRYRKNINGEGSFDKAIKGLNLLLEKFPSNSIGKIRVNLVLAPPFDFETLNTFIKEELPIDFKKCSASLVNDTDTNFLKNHPYTDNDIKQVAKMRLKAEECFITGKWDDNPVAWLFFGSDFRKIHHRNRKNISGSKYVPTGQCVPSSHKLYVDVNGIIHMCERIQDLCSIGDVDNGLDRDKIQLLLNEFYKNVTKNCQNCYALRFCGICLASSLKNGAFTNINKESCSGIKKQLKENIASYARIIAKNKDAFKDSSGFFPSKTYAQVLKN